MYTCNGMMGAWGWLGAAFSLLILALIVGGVILLARRYTPAPGPAPASSAENILAERYARGDIDDQEYQQRLRVLRGNP